MGVRLYSTLGGLVGKTWRATIPSRSRSRRDCVSIRLEMPGTARCISLNRRGFAPGAIRIGSIHLSPIWIGLAEPYTLSQLAAEISRQPGKPIAYKNLSEADYKAALPGPGLPEGLAALLADSDTGASKGALFDDSRQLSSLVGRPATPLAAAVSAALGG